MIFIMPQIIQNFYVKKSNLKICKGLENKWKRYINVNLIKLETNEANDNEILYKLYFDSLLILVINIGLILTF